MSLSLDEKKVDTHGLPEVESLDGSDEKNGHFDAAILPEKDILGMQVLDSDMEAAVLAAQGMSVEDIEECLKYILETHESDPNFPPRPLEIARKVLYDDNVRNDPVVYEELFNEAKLEAALLTINSAYAEVRAVVSNEDPDVPSLTFRTWTIGILYVMFGAFINQFFTIRQPGILIYANVAQLLAFPVGKAMHTVLPTREFTTFGNTWSLNPGRFNTKEHILITIMANVGFTAPYTKSIVIVQVADRFFNQSWARNFGYQILISLSTNFIGYGLAGITRRFLVYPSACIWPTTLATIALNKAFHTEYNETVHGWKISRMRFFMYCFLGMFVYFWFPNYLFQALSNFNWMTWIAPDNVMLAAVTGSISGLGLNPIPTFDWNIFTTVLGDPLVNPFFTFVNFFIGALCTLPVILALWVNNVWYTAYLPINSNGVFDNTGKRYNISLTVDENALFDQESYKSYSPAYLAAGNILLYGWFFAIYTAVLSHTYIYHRKELYSSFRSLIKRRSLDQIAKFDVHVRLMKKYKEVPEWHYIVVLVFAIALGAAGVGAYPTQTTPAVVLYGVFLAVIFCIPIGLVKSITNADITLNVLAEFLGGLWFPGNANAMNFFKSYGYVTTAHTLSFAQDLKLAHYCHIPPRATFWAQMVATFVSTFVCIAVLNFQLTGIADVCSPTQPDRFTCPGQNTFFTASVLWGTLGPVRMFGAGAIYNPLLWCFLVGFVMPFVFYYGSKKYPALKHVHVPVILAGALIWAPYNLAYLWPALPVSFAFGFYIKRRYFSWWGKFNYVLSAAFASAIAISAIIQFFAVEFKSVHVNWVGNTISYNGCDNAGCPLLKLAKGEHFGPGVGEFS
ncbi:OPT-domain-containing protein [Mycena floridula]|nr:OPT-domain-containing protein [Mycena floridula]